jgi:hypothetical protein
MKEKEKYLIYEFFIPIISLFLVWFYFNSINLNNVVPLPNFFFYRLNKIFHFYFIYYYFLFKAEVK